MNNFSDDLNPSQKDKNQQNLSNEIDTLADESNWVDDEIETSERPVSNSSKTNFSQKNSLRVSPTLVTVETAFLASTASLIWLINYYFPLGPVLRIFFALPIALVYLRWGQRASWMAAIVSGLLLSVLMGPTRSIVFLSPME